MARRWITLLALLWSLVGVTTSFSTAAHAYDNAAAACAHAQETGAVEDGPAQLGNGREQCGSPSASARGASTTLFRSFIATEAEAGFPGIKPGAAGGETAGKAFPGSVRQAALEENPSTCVYCHMETDAPQVDHAIPRVQGGNATLENAQTTCGWCNASKGGRTFPVNPPPGYEGAWPPPWWNIFGP